MNNDENNIIRTTVGLREKYHQEVMNTDTKKILRLLNIEMDVDEDILFNYVKWVSSSMEGIVTFSVKNVTKKNEGLDLLAELPVPKVCCSRFTEGLCRPKEPGSEAPYLKKLEKRKKSKLKNYEIHAFLFSWSTLLVVRELEVKNASRVLKRFEDAFH